MKLRIGLKNFKGVFARVWFSIATSDRLSFASVEIDKNYSLTLHGRKSLCHRWSRDQPQPGSFRQSEAVERESLGTRLGRFLSPGTCLSQEVALKALLLCMFACLNSTKKKQGGTHAETGAFRD